MSLRRIFSLFICIVALCGIIGSRNLSLFADGSISNGFAPLLYSLILAVCGIFLFFSDKTREKLNIRAWLVNVDRRKACLFFLLNVLLLIMLFFFGLIISMFVFSILSGYTLKRQAKKSMVLFSVIYVIGVYFVFVMVLKMPFDRGLVFDLIWRY